jgi:hypothetical protein
MVLSNASKSARHQAALINRTNVCGGGAKKSGLPSRIGRNMLSNTCSGAEPNCAATKCVVFKITQTQNYGYRATHRGV